MAKIGIITIQNSPNYGACLQSFALYEYIRLQGHDVEIIDLHRPYHSDYIQSRRFKPYTNRFETIKQKIKRYIRRIIKTTDYLYSPHCQIYDNLHIIKKSLAIEKFRSFNSSIVLSQTYHSIDELYTNPPTYDIYITGSDQVWNPTQTYCIEPYFLTFVRKGRKISYASSIGIEKLTHREERHFAKWLKSYEFISVRETEAKKLLDRITMKKVLQVPDPTLLLGQQYWKEKAKYPEIKSYVLVFTLSFDSRLLEYGCNIARKMNLTTISLNTLQPDINTDNYIKVMDAGPEEWLGYIANAELVITDSFHCTLFSILLRTKDFRTYISPYNQRGARITNLLNIFSLRNHLLTDIEILNKSYEYKTIDFDAISYIVSEQREIGRSFLSHAI